VLEKMREAAAALRLEAETDLVVDADGDDRRCGVGCDDYLEPICEGGAFNGDFQMDSPGEMVSITFPASC
jgi:hypothetical protein